MRQHLGQTLWKPYLWNHWIDLYHLKLYGIVSTCSCATSLSIHLHLGFSRSDLEIFLSQARQGQLTWKERGVDRMLHPLCDFQLWPQPWPWAWILKVKFWKSRISGMGWPIDMEWKECELLECWTHVVTFNIHLTHDLDLRFSWSNFEKVVSQEWDSRLTWNERDVNQLSTLTSPMTLTLDFQSKGLTLGHGAWQKDRPSNGSMCNSYSFQPVGPWMGYSFTDLGAEGCYRSLKALLQFPTCWHMNGLFVYWSRGWGVLSFSECLVIHETDFIETVSC